MLLAAQQGIIPYICHLLKAEILWPCHLVYNTLLLPVRKPEGMDYCPVQDLRMVNEQVVDIHPTVPNPYTLLATFSEMAHHPRSEGRLL